MATAERKKHGMAAVKADGKRAAKKAAYSPTMDALTRLGYAVRGVMYAMIGLLALQGALGNQTTPADQVGAFAAIGRLPYGHIALWVVLVGLISYSLWGFIRAILDPFHKGSDTPGWLARAGYVSSAISYAFFAYLTYELIRGTGSSGGTNQTVQFVSRLMAMPWGRLAVGLFGAGVLVGGLFQIYMGFTSKFEHQFNPYALTAEQLKTAKQMGKFGTIIRGILFGIVGFFLILAASAADPTKARGFDGALKYLGQQPYGLWLLTVMAAGLIILGVYSLMSAAWFKLKR